METWSYRRNGAVEGPVSKDQLRSLYDAGEITRQTLIRSSSAGGEWRRYGDVAGLAPSRIPRAVRNLWPWFVFGTPFVGGLIDVFLTRSTGNAFVESNASWLSHAPLGVNILAIALWLFLIWNEIRKRGQKDRLTGMAVWLIAAPLYESFSWWTTALVASLIHVSFGFGLPECQADIATAQVEERFEKGAAKSGEAGASPISLTDRRQLWQTDRIRMCAGKLVTNSKTYSVRYAIEDHGNSVFRNTMHGLSINMLVE